MKFKPFRNERLIDFTQPLNKNKMLQALAKVKSEFGREYSIIIGGQRVRLDNKFDSINPSQTNEVVGTFQEADIETANKAMEIALETFESWRYVPAKVRASYLFKIARIMRKRRLELAAWMVYESGKNWIEADADVAEAIDFCDYYGHEVLRYDNPPKMVKFPNEHNEMFYIPLGAGIVIAPWNFPLAILCGMTTAAFSTGNTVIMKPAEESPTIAAKFMEIIEEAKVPVGVVNFLTGHGKPAADHLVKHPKTRFICFTGSKAVGLYIVEQAGKHQPGQKWIKRVIAEMGGKDFIIVDSDADIDSAVRGVLASAYGLQGQKCSACSRLILDDKVYDRFMQKFIPMVEAIKMGPVEFFENYLGPVINETAYNSILEYINAGSTEGRLVCGGGKGSRQGYFIQPTVIENIEPHHRVFQEEIFGPVLSVIRSKNFDHAIELANAVEYGLTGAVYSKNRMKLEQARIKAHVGNLYFNRKCTGALVGVQPFGGFNLSGTDSKAGGPDYLLLFMQAKSVSHFLGAKKKPRKTKKKKKVSRSKARTKKRKKK